MCVVGIMSAEEEIIEVTIDMSELKKMKVSIINSVQAVSVNFLHRSLS